jgi:ketosteroid isomerase-like protein
MRRGASHSGAAVSRVAENKAIRSASLLFALVFAGIAALPAQEEDQRHITALEIAWNEALRMKDTKAIAPLLAPELVLIDWDGSVMGKAAYLESLKSPKVAFEHVASNSMRVQVYGHSAIVTGLYQETGIRNGKAFKHDERFVDTWIDRNNTWMCVASQSTLITH